MANYIGFLLTEMANHSCYIANEVCHGVAGLCLWLPAEVLSALVYGDNFEVVL
jgi:hypothetical protein